MITNDIPISVPSEDEFGIDPFARAIAGAISKISAPEGTVVALTGPWGSGKSSAINLVRHHLRRDQEDDRITVISFNPWWYSDDQALTRAFFQHLYAGLGRAKSEAARAILLRLAKGLLSAAPIGAVVNTMTFGLGGSLADKAATAAAELIKTERTIEEEFKLLSAELQSQNKRFLVIIDDIDRLTPEQALLVFRLVKSIGRLPSVIYLLAFDRDFAEKILHERYPAERHFLEKIVQASFEIPLPDSDSLRDALLAALNNIVDHPKDEKGVRYRNLLADVVYPNITLPRDLVRFIGNVSVVWAAIGAEVDLADLVAMEALRLFKIRVYQAIRANKILLCGTGGDTSGTKKDLVARYEEVFLSSDTSDVEKDVIRVALRRLFPRLDSVWGNLHHSSSDRVWRAERRICDPAHFSSYFKLALGQDVLPRRVVNDLIEHVGDSEYVRQTFLDHLSAVRKNGKSDIPLLLDELTAMPQRIPVDMVPTFLASLFEIADRLDIQRDEEPGGFAVGNELRLHWLVKALIEDRFDQPERSTLFRAICRNASFGVLISYAERVYDQAHPRRADQERPVDQRLVDENTTALLIDLALSRIRQFAANGTLCCEHHLLSTLFRWREFAADDGKEVKTFTDLQLANDEFVLKIADALTVTAWISSLGWDGMGDRVSRGVPRVRLDRMDSVIDVRRFLERLTEVERCSSSEEKGAIISRFREGLANSKQDTPDDGDEVEADSN